MPVKKFQCLPRNERGSALILVMLVLLLLTGLGMVSLHDVSESVRRAGMYRVRAQASEGSNALSRFMTRRVGDNARGYWNMMQDRQDTAVSGFPTFTDRVDAVARGGYTKISHTDMTGALPGASAGETGLFNSDGSTTSFESANGAGGRFTVMLRDPLDGIRAPNYSGGFCFKKVTIITEYGVGPADPDWDASIRSAIGRHVTDGFIGPIECGSR